MSGIVEVLLNEGYKISGLDIVDGVVMKCFIVVGVYIFIGYSVKNIVGVSVVVVFSVINEENFEVKVVKEVCIFVI